MGVEPKIGGKPPKWMVYFMEPPIKIHDLGGKNPYFWFNTHIAVEGVHLTTRNQCIFHEISNTPHLSRVESLACGIHGTDGWDHPCCNAVNT